MTDLGEALLRTLKKADADVDDPSVEVADRTWGAIEHRIVNGPAAPPLESPWPPTLPGGGLKAMLLKVVTGTLLVGAAAYGAGTTTDSPDVVAVAAVDDERTPSVRPRLDHADDHDQEDLHSDDVRLEDVRTDGVRVTPPHRAVEDETASPVAEPVNDATPDPPSPRPRGTKRTRRTVSPRAPAEPTAEPTKSLADEVQLMQRTSSALKRSDAATVLALVAEHERDFPTGALLEERVAAKARGLCMRGKTDRGRKEAAKLRRRWPTSIHLPGVDEDCGR